MMKTNKALFILLILLTLKIQAAELKEDYIDKIGFHALKILSDETYSRFSKQVEFLNKISRSKELYQAEIKKLTLDKKSKAFFLQKLTHRKIKIIDGVVNLRFGNSQFIMSASDFYLKQFWVNKQLVKFPTKFDLNTLKKKISSILKSKRKVSSFFSIDSLINSAFAGIEPIDNIIMVSTGMLYIIPPQYDCEFGDHGKKAWEDFTREVTSKLEIKLKDAISRCRSGKMPFDKDTGLLNKINDNLNHNRKVNEPNLIAAILGVYSVKENLIGELMNMNFTKAAQMSMKDTVKKCRTEGSHTDRSLANAVATVANTSFTSNNYKCYSFGGKGKSQNRTSPFWKFAKRFNRNICGKFDELKECIQKQYIICDYKKLKYDSKIGTSYYHKKAISGNVEGKCWRADMYINNLRIKNKSRWEEEGILRPTGQAIDAR